MRILHIGSTTQGGGVAEVLHGLNRHRAVGGRAGFTLVETLFILLVLGFLAAVVVPLFGDAMRKSKEGQTKVNLGLIRNALSVYYADNDGRFPAGPYGFNTTYLQAALTSDIRYLRKWPMAHCPPHHPKIATVDTFATSDAKAEDPTDDGEWIYVSNQDHEDWGKIMVECYHTDMAGTIWTDY